MGIEYHIGLRQYDSSLYRSLLDVSGFHTKNCLKNVSNSLKLGMETKSENLPSNSHKYQNPYSY